MTLGRQLAATALGSLVATALIVTVAFVFGPVVASAAVLVAFAAKTVVG